MSAEPFHCPACRPPEGIYVWQTLAPPVAQGPEHQMVSRAWRKTKHRPPDCAVTFFTFCVSTAVVGGQVELACAAMQPRTFWSVQFLRFVAAFLVVLSHANYFANIYRPSPALFTYYLDFGHSGVHIFFVISGFVMVCSTFDRLAPMSSRVFLLRRFMRIYPIYWFYALFYFAWRLLDAQSLSLGDIVKSLILLPSRSAYLIPQAWTLSYEIYFYLCFSGIIALGMKRGLAVLTAFFVTMIALRRFLYILDPNIDLISNSLLIEFLAGAAIAASILKHDRLSATASSVLIGSAIAGFGVGLIFGYDRIPSVVSWGIPSMMLVAGVAHKELAGWHSPFIRRFAYLGDSSYSLYLMHSLVLMGLVAFVSAWPMPRLAWLGLCLSFSLICIPISIWCYRAIEKPIGNLRTRRKAEMK